MSDGENQKKLIKRLSELQQEVSTLEKSKALIRQNLLTQKVELHHHKVLLENIPLCVFYKDCNGFYLSCNGKCAQALKTNAQDISGKTDFDFYPEEFALQLKTADQQVIEQGMAVENDYSLIDEEKERVVRVIKIPIKSPCNDIVGILGISSDITERAFWERDIRKRDSILEAVRFAAEKFLIADTWETVIQRVLEIFGHAVDVSRVYLFQKVIEKDGSPVATNWHEWNAEGIIPICSNPTFHRLDWRKYGLHKWEEILSSNRPLQGIVSHFPLVEKEFLMKQGVKTLLVVPVFVNDSPWGSIGFDDCIRERQWSGVEIDSLRAAASVLGVAIGRAQVTRAVRESERRFRSITHSASEAIICSDTSGTIVFWNDAATRMFGYSTDEITGTPIKNLIPPEMRDCFFEKMHSASLQSNGTSPVKQEEFALVRKDGTPLPAEITISTWSSQEDQFYSTIVRDITERKEAEKNLRKVREEFFTTLTHDMKAPLTAISGYVQLIRKPQLGPISEKKVEYINMIDYNLDVMLSLIDNILDSSRIEEGRMHYHFENFKIKDLIKELHLMFHAMALLKNVTLDFKCPDDAWVHADRRSLYRVLNNLMNNALRYTSPRGTISISVAPKDNRYEIAFSDTGAGIPSSDHEVIFQKYGKAAGEKRGTGLGLFIIKKLLQDHGTNIRVESTPGKGTSFFFSIEQGKPLPSDQSVLPVN